ncbi:MAG: GNAT family N-acetyltransferase [Actinomycetota bacterium]|nr:GNAT family N-acetyltransferase [Actinomycetota bacterium]
MTLDLPPVLHGPRLDLVLVTVEQLLSRDGSSDPVPLALPDPHNVLDPRTSPLLYRIVQVRTDPSVNPWLIRLAVLRGVEPAIVGLGNFHGPPDQAGMVEIGYSVIPVYRGQGFGREIATMMWDAAARHPDVRVLRATVAPDNEPSLAIVRAAGLVHVGEQEDPVDGLELVFELPADEYFAGD